MLQDFSSHLSKFLSNAKLVKKRQKKLSLVRHRLDDNFQWRCSTCHSVVPTYETHLHLNSCFDNTNSFETEGHILSQLTVQEFDKKLLCVAIKPMDKNQRPRTKRLERPTPNLNHPVINGNISKESKQIIKDKYFLKKDISKDIPNETTNKSQAKELRQIVNQIAEEMNETSVCEKNSKFECKTCNREIGPEKIHFHNNAFTHNKHLVLRRNKNENSGKSPTFPNESSRAHNKPINSNASKNNFQSKSSDSLAQHKAKTEPKVVNEISRCKICNNSFESISLSAHQQQCFKAKKGQKMKKDANDTQVNESMNKDGCDPAGWEHFKSQLVPCSRCGRTFFPHRLPIHEKSCRGIAIKQTTKTTVNTGMKVNIPSKSVFLDCTTCGRKYSTTSLTIHELKCRNNNRKLSTGKCDNTNEMNNAWEHFKTQLVPCSKCSRKFLADRLEKHEPICKAIPINYTENQTNK